MKLLQQAAVCWASGLCHWVGLFGWYLEESRGKKGKIIIIKARHGKVCPELSHASM